MSTQEGQQSGHYENPIRTIEHHVIVSPRGFIQLPEDFLRELGVDNDNPMISFVATQDGFKVSAGPKPPYVHYETKEPMRTPSRASHREPDRPIQLDLFAQETT